MKLLITTNKVVLVLVLTLLVATNTCWGLSEDSDDYDFEEVDKKIDNDNATRSFATAWADYNNNDNSDNHDNNAVDANKTLDTRIEDKYDLEDDEKIVDDKNDKSDSDDDDNEDGDDRRQGGKGDDNDDEEEGDEDEDEYDNIENICTAEYFIDRLIPQDYPEVISRNVSNLNETIQRFNRLYDFMDQVQVNMTPFVKDLASRLYDYIYESELDAECTAAMLKVFSEVQNQKQWAFAFLDSSGSILSGGFQEGMFASLGEFDQCLSIDNADDKIYGQYCLVKPKFPLPAEESYREGEPLIPLRLPMMEKFFQDKYIQMYLELYQFMRKTVLRLGVCLPQRCRPQNIEHAINKLLVRKTGLSVEVGDCVTAKDDTVVGAYQLAIIYIFAFLLTLVVASSLFEVIFRMFAKNPPDDDDDTIDANGNETRPPKGIDRQVSKRYEERPMSFRLLTTFSAIRNTRLLSMAPAKHCLQLDGIKLFMVLYFFALNSYYICIIWAPMVLKRFYVVGPLQMLTERKYFLGRLYYLNIYFYILAGAALSIHLKTKNLNYVGYVLKTYVQYLVAVLFSVLVLLILPLFGSGPLWHLFDEIVSENCRRNYLPTIFFYNNLDENFEDKCNPFTMLVSGVVQLKLLAPLILLAVHSFSLNTKRIVLLSLYLLATAASIVPRVYFDLKHYLEYDNMKTFSEVKRSLVFYNFNPIYQAAPFILGMLVGSLIQSPPKKKISPALMMVAGVASFGLLWGYMHYLEQIDLLGPQLPLAQVLLILSVGQVCLSLFFCWLCLACTIGDYRILGRFFSFSPLTWMKNLSYNFVVCSAIAIFYRIFSIRHPITMDGQTMFRLIVSDCAVCFLWSYLAHLLLIAPFKNLQRLDWAELFGFKRQNLPITK